MSDSAIKNLMDVEYLDSDQLGISYQRFEPGFVSIDGHSHEVQEEAYVILSGSGQIKLGDEVVELKKWDVVRVAPKVVRGFDAGPDGLELIAVGAKKPEGGDGVIAKGRWAAPGA